ncbi:MAG: LytTR family DNA-binding domain-containing protein [Lachnospiraceae bacterium]|nr:LytTR family DNA-binding domain-containing protein [Lachnospiraceae bacterium]
MEALAELTRKCDTVGAVFCVDNSADAYKYAMENEIDLFLVDIILDGENAHDVSGIVLIDNLRKVMRYEFTPVIFITSLVDEAMNAFHNLHCYDYIEKPFDLEKVGKIISTALKAPLCDDRDCGVFYYRKDGVLYALNIDRMIYLETSFRNVMIYTLDETIEIPYMSLKNLMKDLPRKYFIQCSRNTVVNRRFIEYADKANQIVKLRNGKRIKIGGRMKKGFFEEL